MTYNCCTPDGLETLSIILTFDWIYEDIMTVLELRLVHPFNSEDKYIFLLILLKDKQLFEYGNF